LKCLWCRTRRCSPPVLCMQADFFRHESPVADSPYPEGCTSRLGRAQRVRSGGIARRRAVQQRWVLFLLPKSEAVFRGPNAAPGRMVVCRGFRRRIEERCLRRRCNRHSNGIQQTVIFKFAHRALLIGELWSFRPLFTHRDSPNTTDASFRVMNESF